jgi:glutaminyl-peptide cyclotransferase
LRGLKRAAWFYALIFGATLAVACTRDSGQPKPGSAQSSGANSTAAPVPPRFQIPSAEAAPPATQTGGFDGAKAFEHVAQLVAIGPRPPASDGIRRAQDYIRSQLQSFGCTVDGDDFHAQTPIGSLAMKNIIAKSPGTGQGIILLLTHYDTLSSVKNFVGAEDSGSSTGLMLEIARLLCPKKEANAVWIAFLDGEEAFVNWNTDNDNTYGSRELAARLALSGDLKKIKAVILADMIGQSNLRIERETNSTKWLTDLVWSTAARLGYKDIFVNQEQTIADDHQPFLDRKVPAVDLIDYNGFSPYWHTTQDTLDKVSPRSLAIVGYVILESVGEFQKKSH